MKHTGIELIFQERKKQLQLHGKKDKNDIEINKDGQLADAAEALICKDWLEKEGLNPPDGWNLNAWQKLLDKSYKERLIIAGAFIAAEIDRIILLESNQ
ncbi:MAG: hypothetical protein LUG18_11355 [Candidatus Azobacteroides sp.]|nr:hypothetical protein [Candidatus Azobacteroides sp.]